MTVLGRLAGVLSSPKYLSAAAIAAAAFGFLLSITSGVFVVGFWAISPIADPLMMAMVAGIALLFGLNAAVLLRNFDRRKEAAGSTGMTAMGAFAALMTSSCPFCHPYLLFSLGAGGLGAVFAGFSLIIGGFSMLMLSVSLAKGLDEGMMACQMAGKARIGGGKDGDNP